MTNEWKGCVLGRLALAIAAGLVFGIAPVALCHDLEENIEVLWTPAHEPELLAKATELQTPVAIYEFVRNNIRFVSYHGSRSSSVNTFLGQIGNDVDIASTLIAMLRSQGIRARYVTGLVRVPAADFVSWLGVRNVELGASILSDQGIQDVALLAGDTFVQFEHVWVQAFVSLDRYRGSGAAGRLSPISRCTAPDECSWVDLAPAFKLQEQRNASELINLYNVVPFDYDAYYRALAPDAMSPDGIDRADKGPLEIYEEQLLAYLRGNFPGKTLEDVADAPTIIREDRRLLPESLPFKVVSAATAHDSVSDHDAVEGVKNWRKYLEVLPTYLGITTNVFVPLAELSTKRFSYGYYVDDLGFSVSGFRLDGEPIGPVVSISSSNIGITTPLRLVLRLDGPPDTSGSEPGTVYEVTYDDLILGGYYMLSAGGETSNFSQVHRAARQLLAANEAYPVVLDPSDDAPYIDENANGLYDDGVDTPLLEHQAAADSLVGGLLYSAQELYYARLRAARDRLQALNHVISPIGGFLGVISSVHEIEYLEETAFSVMPGGLLIDMKGIQSNGNWRNDAPEETAPEHFELFGHVGSSLEHEIWQELTGYDALSTVRGIQFALRDGATLVDAKKNADEDTLITSYAELGFFDTPPAGITQSATDLFATKPNTYSVVGDDQSFNMFKALVDPDTTSLRGLLLTYDTSLFHEENIAYFDDEEERLKAVGGGDSSLNLPDICGDTTVTGTGVELLVEWSDCYDIYVALQGDFLAFLDENQGFVPSEYVYRDAEVPITAHDATFVRDIRNDIAGRDITEQWVEYVLPSERTSGPFYLFTVYLKKQYVADDGELILQTFAIQNHSGSVAGGGYVNGEEPLELTNTNLFNNEVLTDRNLIGHTNNDRVRTPSTEDPISTVTGNMYLDEVDFSIKGRGFPLAFTRTYNSGPRDDDTGLPMGFGWSHSYDMHLVANDYRQRSPNSSESDNGDGITSSISYVDERGGEQLFSTCAHDLAYLDASQPESSGWIDVTCRLGTLAPGDHTVLIGAYNNKKDKRDEITFIYIDDVEVRGELDAFPLVDAHFETDAEGFVYLDDTFLNSTRAGYASGAHSPTLGKDGGGGLYVSLGGLNGKKKRGMSGGWRKTFTLSQATPVVLRYSYKLYRSPTYDSDEWSLSMLSVDATTLEINRLPTWKLVNPRAVFTEIDFSQADSNIYTMRFRNGVEYTFGGDLRIPGNRAVIQQIQDPYGNTLSFTYDANGRLESVDDNLSIPERTGLHLEYDTTTGQLVSVTDWTGRSYRYTYDPDDNLETVTDPLLNTVTYEYQAGTHRLTNVIHPADRDGDMTGGDVTISYDYYRNGKAFSNFNALGEGEVVDYDLFRKRTRVTDPRGFVRTHFYDRNGELTKMEEADGGIHFFDHTEEGLRFMKRDALGYETRYSYCLARDLDGCLSDTGGQITLESDRLGHESEIDYGIFDQPTRTRDRNGNEMLFTYYETTDPTIGAVRGRLQKREIAGLNGSPTPVLLVEYAYYPDGTLDTVKEHIDPANPLRIRETELSYEKDGLNVVSVVVSGSGESIVRTYEYDALGRPVAETLSRLASPTDPTIVPVTRRALYDELDRERHGIDALGNYSITEYDENSRVYRRINRYFDSVSQLFKPDRIVSENGYDLADRLKTQTAIDGGVSTFTYDPSGNVLAATDANGHVTKYEYDEKGRRSVAIDERGFRSQLFYDLEDRVVKLVNASGEVTRYFYDAEGRKTSIEDPLGYVTEFEYDDHGNLVKIIDANATQFPVGSANRLARVNSEGATVFMEYDELNRRTRTLNAEGGETLYTYDLLGNVVEIRDAELRTTEMKYDDLGRLIEIIDPLQEFPVDKTIHLYYDQADNMIRQVDRKGQETLYHYDLLNRVKRIEYLADGSEETFVYDAFEDLVSVSNPDITWTLEYDNKHRLESKTDERLGRSLLYEYDLANNLTQKTDYQGGITEFQYDRTNRLVSQSTQEYLQVSYHYDPAGRLVNRILSNGLNTSYVYDLNSRITNLRHTTADGSITLDQEYAYDRLSNIASLTRGADVTDFDYDLQYRLISADYTAPLPDHEYTYDLVGNRRTQTGAFGTRHFIYDVGNRLREVHDGSDIDPLYRSFDYDDNGNVTAKRDGAGTILQSYTFDSKNRITAIDGPNLAANSYRYDPGDYRIEKIDSDNTRHYLLEGEHLEAVYDDTGVLRDRYLRGFVIDEIVNAELEDSTGSRVNLSFHQDQLGSVEAVSDHTGSTVAAARFGPFGNLVESTGVSPNYLRYTGRELDADTGLYNYRRRYYDPEIGRFLSEDPLRFDAGINFYSYVGNNPINANDPSGKELALFSLGLNVSFPTLLVLQPVAPQFTLSITLGVGRDARVFPPVFDADLVVTGELGLTAGTPTFFPGSIFLRGGGSLDSEVTAESLTGGSLSATTNLLLFSGSATRPSSGGTIYEAGITSPDISASGSAGFGFSVPDLISSGIDFLKDLFSSESPGDAASGGFVLYPSRPNLNQVERVYEK